MDSIIDVTEVVSDEEVLDIEPEVVSLESDSDGQWPLSAKSMSNCQISPKVENSVKFELSH